MRQPPRESRRERDTKLRHRGKWRGWTYAPGWQPPRWQRPPWYIIAELVVLVPALAWVVFLLLRSAY